MSARETVRRLLIWLGVALFLVATVWAGIRTGDFTGLISICGFPVVGALILASCCANGVGRVM